MQPNTRIPLGTRAHERGRRVVHATWSALLALLFLAVTSTAHAQSAQIIVNPELDQLPLDRTVLRAIFTMRLRSWPDGLPIRVFVLPDSDPLSDRFYREELGMYSYVLRAAWDRMVFTGTGLAPTVVRSEAEMRMRVRETPGAIGYISEDKGAGLLRRRKVLRTAFLGESLE